MKTRWASWMRISTFVMMLLIAGGLIAQYTLPDFPQSFGARKYARGTYVPSTLTGLAGQSVVVTYLRFANQSSSTATITVTDQSTDCGGAQCQIIPATTLAGNAVWFVPLGPDGEFFKGGFAWSATGSASVNGYVMMKY